MKRLLIPVVALLAILSATAVFAHAEPVRVRPGDGAVLTSPPIQVEIEMSQDLARREGANTLAVFDATGREVTTVAAVIDNGNRRRITVALPSTLAPGLYTVRWRSLSADDGDAAEGTTTFTYDPNGRASPGKEVLREDVLGPAQASPTSVALGSSSSGGGTSWVLVAAVAAGMFVVGSGVTFLLIQKKP